MPCAPVAPRGPAGPRSPLSPFGPGTGAFWILALVTLLGQELTRANAYTKVVNLASNLGSLLVFAAHGQVAPWVALAMIAGQLLGARLGSGLVLRHGAGLIRGEIGRAHV